ncbi:MAG: cyclic nucleotide-binding domain-containing protein [Actinomycetia bacterium]|nr:cyclic nucleotide-binding domain-containing protein [Actinomycetes bacterium]MCH9759491.1 cyclic nucleotide-binding domain-containing protein [Actinomycetes bacterium]
MVLKRSKHLGDDTGRGQWVELREGEDAATLRTFPLFAKFSDDDLQLLVQSAHHDSMSGPWPLIHEQTPADSCFVLLSGEVGVYVGRDHVATLGPGEVIGHSAIKGGALRTATVTTTGPAEVLRIESEDLVGLLDAIPALREAIDETLARHTPPALAHPTAPEEPTYAKVNASVPTELVHRFEEAAKAAQVSVADALEDALTEWIERDA